MKFLEKLKLKSNINATEELYKIESKKKSKAASVLKQSLFDLQIALKDLEIKSNGTRIKKDFKDTFKSYKSIWHAFSQDAIYPLKGAANILLGIASIVAALGLVLKNLFTKKESIKISSRIFLIGIVRLLRGLSQLIAFPFVWLRMITIRPLITLVNGFPIFERGHISQLVKATPDEKAPGKSMVYIVSNLLHHLLSADKKSMTFAMSELEFLELKKSPLTEHSVPADKIEEYLKDSKYVMVKPLAKGMEAKFVSISRERFLEYMGLFGRVVGACQDKVEIKNEKARSKDGRGLAIGRVHD